MPGKVIPQPDDLTLELFQAIASTGQMHVQQCADCGAYAHPPRYYCARCFSPRYRMTPVSGAGTVYSHTLSHYTTEPAWKDDVPYATVVVELDTSGTIDVAAERRRLEKDLAAAQKELASTAAKLANADFLAKAPEAVVGKIRDRQRVAHEETERITARLAALQ